MTRLGVFAAAWALCLAPAVAAADHWIIASERSRLVFDYVANGIPGQGRFEKFEGEGRFDPAAPEASTLRLDIWISGLTLGDPLRDAFVRGPDWFALAAHPRATFELSELVAVAGSTLDGDFLARGELTLKGVTRIISTPVRLKIEGGEARAVGSTEFDPLAFGIGDGPSALFVSVGETVTVSFDMVAVKAEH